MGFPINKPLTFIYKYDFAALGGATGDIALTLVGNNAISSSVILTGFTMFVSTALVGVGATVTMGNAGDKDGYAVDFAGDATPAGAVITSGDRAGALVWDDTNDHAIAYKPAAADAAPSITIGTAALTAGVFTVVFTGYRPA